MRTFLFSALLAFCTLQACTLSSPVHDQHQLTNAAVRDHAFVADMYAVPFFPKPVVAKGRNILIDLCYEIEAQKPKGLQALYVLTHRATGRFNDLQIDFEADGSELETGARETIGMDLDFIARAYGYDADVEELIAPRAW